jgi:DNA-binding IclR family transcriptional regulator
VRDNLLEPKVKSLSKALKLLKFFTAEHPERGITELSELSGLVKSNVHNMVKTFEWAGFLEKNPVSNKYRLGMRVLQLSNTLYASHDLRRLVYPYLVKLCNYSRETIYLATQSENEVLYIDSLFPVGVTPGCSAIGLKAPLYCTGIGKAILANLPENEVDQIVACEKIKFTPYTIVDPQLLGEELAQIRAQGYAVDNMEHEYGISCIAAPLKNMGGKTVAAISISGPSLRFSNAKIQEYSQLLLEVAAELQSLIQ